MLGPVTLASGTGSAEVEIARLPFAEGTYVLDAALSNASSGSSMHTLPAGAEIVVRPSAPEGSAGLVTLDADWS